MASKWFVMKDSLEKTPPTDEPTSMREWATNTIYKLFEEVADTVNGQRQETYGSPQDSFQQIADLWEAYLKRRADGPLGPQDVANMMILMKVSRSATGGYHHDSTVDIIGYAALKEVI